ncbi:L,D-transpeptidase [Bacillus carboniphilus]|uniref:L,D-transpeptidase n=1 Tax=Bacillus carboniphilus TaxID=86663 RepID=UPI0035322FFE
MKIVKISLCFMLLCLGFLAPIENVSAKTNQLIIINKSTNQLAFFEDGQLVKTFSVATGRNNGDSKTPEGIFPIVNKIKNRPYYKENIPGGDPSNPLGDRWLGLHANGTPGTTYAIHGNANSNSIGTYASAGCIRMHNEEIRWLFDRVKKQTDVYILQSSKSFALIAADYDSSLYASVETTAEETKKEEQEEVKKPDPEPTKAEVFYDRLSQKYTKVFDYIES